MKKTKGILLVAAGLLSIGFFVNHFKKSVPPEEMPHRKLPSIKLSTLEGQETDIWQFKGKPILINIWATWCPYCREEISDLLAFEKKSPGKIQTIFVNRGESAKTVVSYFDTIPNFTSTTTLLLDSKDAFYSAINGFSMPETLIVDKDGMIYYHKRGLMNLEEMRRRTEMIIKDRP